MGGPAQRLRGFGAKPRLVMTDLTRLRALQAVLRGRRPATIGPAEPVRAASVDLEALATGLGGGLEDAPLGPCPVVRWWLGGTENDEPYGHRLGQAARAISAEGLRVLCGDGGGGDVPWSGVDRTAGLMFFDLETTGLSGGAGTVAFVVGFGCFEGSRFHVWQFVLPSFAGERRLLAAVTAAVSRAHTLVTFNGKSFDVPFAQMRWLYHRLETPLAGLRHLDLLHPARRLWGPDIGGLGGLEDRVLGFRRRDDVSGCEIPSRYFDYLRSGDPAPLRGVLSHNRLDLASLAVLTGLACELVEGGPDAAGDARQCLGLGRVYERGGRPADANGCYERAAALTSGGGGSSGRPGDLAVHGERPAAFDRCRLPQGLRGASSAGSHTAGMLPRRAVQGPDAGSLRTGLGATRELHHGLLDVRAEALYRVASARRRQRRHADAALVWRELLDLGRTPGLFEREALRALAVHHEHRLKDMGRALTFARRAYAVARTAHRRRDGQKRVMRLERRLAGEPGSVLMRGDA